MKEASNSANRKYLILALIIFVTGAIRKAGDVVRADNYSAGNAGSG